MNKGAVSVALVSEGRCWHCTTALTVAADGWADCPTCPRRMRITGGVMFERVPVDPTWLGREIEWISEDVQAFGPRGVVDLEVIREGRALIPDDTTWLQWSWPIALARRQRQGAAYLPIGVLTSRRCADDSE